MAKNKPIPSENISIEANPESVVHKTGGFVCEAEILVCPQCGNEDIITGPPICAICNSKDPKNKPRMETYHLLHDPTKSIKKGEQSWQRSPTCVKRGSQ